MAHVSGAAIFLDFTPLSRTPVQMAESASDFKAFVLGALAVLHRGLAEHARATKVRKTE